MSDTLKERKIYRILTNSASKAWDKIAFWTTAKSVDAADGNNLETKVGAIKGITTSTSTTTKGYAADATVIKTLNDSLGGFKFKIENGVKKISTNGGTSWENFNIGAALLWTNPAPKSPFTSQTISLNLTSYDAVIISFIAQPDLDWTSEHRFLVLKGTTQGCNVPMGSDSTSAVANVWHRTAAVNNTGITFGYAINDSSQSQVKCLPVKIYGVKGFSV